MYGSCTGVFSASLGKIKLRPNSVFALTSKRFDNSVFCFRADILTRLLMLKMTSIACFLMFSSS